jgi:hypothetical protein
LTKNISVQLVSETDKPSVFNLADDVSIANKVRYIQVTMFKTVEVTSFDPLNPVYNLVVIGHETIQIWYAPVNVNVPVITSETLASNFTDQLRLTVTSDLAGTVYAVAVDELAAAPTAQQIIAQANYGSTVTLLGKGVDTVAAGTSKIMYLSTISTGLAAAVELDMYYVVVGETSISSVKKVNDFTIGAASSATAGLVAITGTNTSASAAYTAPTGNTLVQFLTSSTASTQAALLAKIVVGVTTVAEVQTLLAALTPTFAAAADGAITGSATGKQLFVLAVTGTGTTAVVQAWREVEIG